MELVLTQLERLKNKNVRKPPFLKPPMVGLMETLHNFYKKNDCHYLRELGRAQKLIIAYTKNGSLTEAQEIIDLSEEILNNLKDEVKILGEIFVFPAYAYNSLKKEEYITVKEYVQEVVKKDDLLTDKFPILHLHKFNHLLNLNQVYIRTKEEEKCVNLFIDIFTYLDTFNLNPIYGKGSKKIISKMAPTITFSSLSNLFIEEYFICIWNNPIIENMILADLSFASSNSTDRNMQAFKEYYEIQKMIKRDVFDYRGIIGFFKRYDYTHDSFKLMILKNLYNHHTCNPDLKNQIKGIIKTKLHFKFPLNLIKKLPIYE